jgi:hypothetical protein
MPSVRLAPQSSQARPATARGDIQGRSSPLTAAVTPRSRSRPRPGPSISAFLVLVGHPSVPGDRLSIVTGAVTTRRIFRCCSDGPGACLGHGAGDSTGQLRYRAGSRDLTLTSGNAQEEQRSWGHAVYGMQGVRGSTPSAPRSSSADQPAPVPRRSIRSPTVSAELTCLDRGHELTTEIRDVGQLRCRVALRRLANEAGVALGGPRPSPKMEPSPPGLRRGRPHRPCHLRAIPARPHRSATVSPDRLTSATSTGGRQHEW